MTEITFSSLVLYFFIYSFLGWLCEVIYCSVIAKKFINRGFLAGPYCPIYAFGSFFVLTLLEPFSKNILLLFITSIIITSILEYIVSWFMEILFDIRWWDYSHFKFNINGRVCLLNSILFGLLSVVMLLFIHPNINSLVNKLNSDTIRILSSSFLILFLFDLVTTLNALYKLQDKLKNIQNTFVLLEKYNKEYDWFDKSSLTVSLDKLSYFASLNGDSELISLSSKLENLLQKDYIGQRFLTSFPKMKNKSFEKSLSLLKKSFSEKKENLYTNLWNITKNWAAKLSVDISDDAESFAGGINSYKIFWVFFIASVIGYFVETIFCLITRGYIESRQGLVYGPFSQVYGIGAVIMLLSLKNLAKRSDRWIFIGGAVIGGVFEYFCSFIQEKAFGTVSWDYSTQLFSIGGRTNLTYMLFWGVLAVVFMKDIYPRLSHFIERIPNRSGFFITWILIIVLSSDILISVLAVKRWADRNNNTEAKNKFEIFMDKHYNDDMLKEVYPNMIFLK